MKLSVKSLVIAAALLKAICFVFVSLLNLILPPYGGAFLALLTSLYLGYDPTAGPISVLVGTVYSLMLAPLSAHSSVGFIIVLLKNSEASIAVVVRRVTLQLMRGSPAVKTRAA